MALLPRFFSPSVAKKAATTNRMDAGDEERLRSACTISTERAFTLLESGPQGLSSAQVADRTKRFGPNTLAGDKKKGFLAELFTRLGDPLVLILIVICGVSFASGDTASGGIVATMVFISVVLGWFQEQRSSDAADKLKLMVQASALVCREGKESEIPIDEVVPGDIVLLASGSIVPADMRLVSAKDFFVTQAALTGESMPVEKLPTPGGTELDLSALAAACLQGSTVLSGTARGIAVNTGMRTFLGSVAASVAVPKDATEFDIGVKAFVRLMIRFMLVMVAAIVVIQGIFKRDWLEAMVFGLSVAVGLTPGMLPMIVTVCLSKGAIFMSRKKVIVKKLKSIQNLGGIDILCTDKTGTITQNRVVLEKHVDVSNRENEDVLRYAWMNAYYQTGLRNILDVSILSNEDLEVERSLRKVDEIPFDFTRKRMSVIVDYEGDHVLICKGSVEAVFEVCNRYQIDDEVAPLIDIVKQDILEDYTKLSAKGYRVLAIAYREFEATRESFSPADESGLVLLGYLAFFDPPKDSAGKAITLLGGHGVRVKVLTGDNELVTAKVCEEVGFTERTVLTGQDLDALDAAGFAEAVQAHDVFARLTPAQKEHIVMSLRASGHVVGFMGDGINDAAAMRASDVGISVDSAADVAKESADIILLEKSLLVLADGIIEGRLVFNNIIKYIKMGASSNFGNMFSMLGSSIILPFLPMSPVQILLNNLLYDVSQTGIPLDNVDKEKLEKPLRWNIGLIRRFMVTIGPVSSLFDFATFALMWFVFGCSAWLAPDATALSRLHIEQLFHTGWFVESLLTQTLIVHIIRTDRIPFIQSRASLSMFMMTGLVMASAIALPYLPFAGLFGFVPLPGIYWLWIACFLLSYGVLTHLLKTWFNASYERRLARNASSTQETGVRQP